WNWPDRQRRHGRAASTVPALREPRALHALGPATSGRVRRRDRRTRPCPDALKSIRPTRHELWHRRAMALSEEAVTSLVDAGCTACNGKRLVVESYVAQKLPLLAGEVYGSPSWGYKGEDLVRGTYRIACDECSAELFSAGACPRCDAAGGIERALE